MNEQETIDKTAEYVRAKLCRETTGHDWWHIKRVLNNAEAIGKVEKPNMYVVRLAVLLHDINDWKLNGGDFTSGPSEARALLNSFGIDRDVVWNVSDIIRNLNYMGIEEASKIRTIEGKVVQDADRLDALGAIGIARCFATSQKLGQMLHDPEMPPRVAVGAGDYVKQYTGGYRNTAINHFYEKLLLIKDRLNTQTAKNIAQDRHDVMVAYLKRFNEEWEGRA